MVALTKIEVALCNGSNIQDSNEHFIMAMRVKKNHHYFKSGVCFN